MKHFFLTTLIFLSILSTAAQELAVKSMTLANSDLTGSVIRRKDTEGNNCALIKVSLTIDDVQFGGNVVGEVLRDGSDYLVFLSSGSKFLQVKHSNFKTLMITFEKYGIKSVTGNKTYLINIGTGNTDTELDKKNKVTTIPDPQKMRFEIPTEFVVNGVSFKMIRVRGGSFTMGADPKYIGKDKDDKHPHYVTISDYIIGETEVTQELWKSVMGYNNSTMINDNYPVDNVSWLECDEFVQKLKEITNLDFRLPTEAEWEFAARGGTHDIGYLYSGGNNVDDIGWVKSNSNDNLHEVKSKKPNGLNIYDMTGNVAEWIDDTYKAYTDEPLTDPHFTEGNYHMVRGGTYAWTAKYLWERSSFGTDINYKQKGLGLRLALSR